MDKTIALLSKYLDGDFRVSPMSPERIQKIDIDSVEKDLGVRFPEEYVFHLLAKDAEILPERGLFIEVKEEIWERPKLYDVGEAWSFLYGIHTYTACQESEDWMTLSITGKEFIEETGIKAVPILKLIGDANCYCTDENGNIVKYNHEENIIEPTNMNFWEILELELKELKERKEKKKN
ncbi:SMI1/KNR4 family protein [Aquimarina algicola]|uniref:Knr4/Smi1-like domain-containing protein n=1 Tax=Aquimarina algicola TaxID=2589995 RepID=A0A504JGC9_9FLAO|nr:SMI1/KNR4 family protein [Aquimarina algicola]TPN86808.1 hypothetical protein FHK87_04175 [Aquimarina algicola]